MSWAVIGLLQEKKKLMSSQMDMMKVSFSLKSIKTFEIAIRE